MIGQFLVLQRMPIRGQQCRLGNQLAMSLAMPHNVRELSPDAERSMKIMSFNLRYAKAPDGRHSWPHRRDLVVDVIKRHQPTILGTQEAMQEQVDFLMTHLAPNYKWFGACRFGTGENERVAIFYDTRRLVIENHGDFWLSKTPDIPGSKSWDSSLPRITTWGRFCRKDLLGDPNESFYFFNTHLDHIGPEARTRGAALIVKKMKDIMGEEASVALLTGDFNSKRSEEPWKVLTGKAEFEGQSGNLVDLWQVAEKRTNEVEQTRHDYKGCKIMDSEGKGHIDFIFCRHGKHKELKVSEVEVVVDGNDDGRFPSDHFPLCAELRF